ncbi:GUN4 domain-containing protein [Tolypothrix bouteillei VB521301_2]|uniref:GUN4 domain-containing protein n=1 Tax=Tolypothrix bouteillei TaxID=1246981 RepID=UPI0038B5DF2D
MISSAVKRRYQSATELLQALNFEEPQKQVKVPVPTSNQIKCPFCSYTFDGTNLSGEIACYRCYKHFYAPQKQVKVPVPTSNQIKCPFCSYTFDGTNLSGEIACYRCYKHFYAPQGRVKVPSSTSNQTPDNLSSQKGINYIRLQNFLKAGQWKEADKETFAVMLTVAGREKDGWLDNQSIENFPCTDLHTIDQLWVTYSHGRFGFSVQKCIWERVSKNYHNFGEVVKWTKGSEWIAYSEVTFITAYGTSPLVCNCEGRLGWQGGDLFSRLKICKMQDIK